MLKGDRNGLLAGIAAGVGGAILWGVLYYCFTSFYLVWLAWGIGAGVGAAVAWGSNGGPDMGKIAVVISVLSILAGWFLPAEVSIIKNITKAKQGLAEGMDDEYMIGCLADEILDDSEGQGHSVTYTFDGENPLDVQMDYSEELWQQATAKWDSMTAAEKEAYRADTRQRMEKTIVGFFSSLRKYNVRRSFDGDNLIFIVLGVVTAYKLASRTV